MKTYMFPGQGSQAKGMGGSLFDEYPEVTGKADKLLGYSIKELCLEDSGNVLGQTEYTQPALYVVNYLSYLKDVEETGEKPDFLIGHSLGEFNALLAAECFDFEAGLKLVKKRSELMSLATDGGMAAVLNIRREEIETALRQNGLENVDLANFNTPLQTVLSGAKEDLARAQAVFEELEGHFLPLNTSGAFHSRLMEPAREQFERYLKRFRFSALKVPVVSNVTALPYADDDVVTSLASQITSPVRWSESIIYLQSLGTNPDEPMEFREIGHGTVLTGLVEKVKREAALSREDDHRSDRRGAPSRPASGQEDTVVAEGPSHSAARNGGSDSNAKGTSGGTPVWETPKEAGRGVGDGSNGQTEHAMDRADGDGGETPNVFAAARRKVQLWNETHPVGTRVRSLTMDYDELETKTEAVVLFGHRAAVYMQGYNGYFDLDEIEAL